MSNYLDSLSLWAANFLLLAAQFLVAVYCAAGLPCQRHFPRLYEDALTPHHGTFL